MLNTIKTEWQCSQDTKQLDKDNLRKQETTPFESDDCLTEHNYEKLKTIGASINCNVSETNQTVDSNDLPELEQSIDTVEDITEESSQEKNDSSDFLNLDDVRLDPVKSRRGRPKGTKNRSGTFQRNLQQLVKREKQQIQ